MGAAPERLLFDDSEKLIKVSGSNNQVDKMKVENFLKIRFFIGLEGGAYSIKKPSH